MQRPLPPAPKQHDQRNQNETRRSIMLMLREVRDRLAAVEAELESD